MGTATLERPAGETEAPHEGSDGALDDEDLAGALELALGGQLSLAIGGKKPTSSSLRIVGGKVNLDGQLDKGQTVAVRLELIVGTVALVDKHDPKTGQVTGTERQHKGRIVGIRVLADGE